MNDNKEDLGIFQLKLQREFRNFLRENLGDYLKQYGYELIHDNEKQDMSITRNWVFRLEYLGKNKIEIYNRDYRDYTEYFYWKVNGNEEMDLLNLNKYNDILIAFEDLKNILKPYL